MAGKAKVIYDRVAQLLRAGVSVINTYDEVKKYAFGKTTKIVKSFKKQFPKLSEEIEAEYAKK